MSLAGGIAEDYMRQERRGDGRFELSGERREYAFARGLWPRKGRRRPSLHSARLHLRWTAEDAIFRSIRNARDLHPHESRLVVVGADQVRAVVRVHVVGDQD